MELEKRKVHYDEMKKECDDNSKRANRIVSNEALFTINTKLQGIEEARDFLEYLHEVHIKSGGYQDRDINKQFGDWLESATNELRSKYYRLIRHEKKRNVAVAAVARELECFVWGMMTDNINVIEAA